MRILSKAIAIWLLMVAAAILNGLVRDVLLAPAIGAQIALPLSGITLSLLVFLITWMSIGFIGVRRTADCVLVGLFWVALTLVFEFPFGHYVAGKSWAEINQVFDLRGGNLFTLVLLVTAVSPRLAARLKGLI